MCSGIAVFRSLLWHRFVYVSAAVDIAKVTESRKREEDLQKETEDVRRYEKLVNKLYQRRIRLLSCLLLMFNNGDVGCVEARRVRKTTLRRLMSHLICMADRIKVAGTWISYHSVLNSALLFMTNSRLYALRMLLRCYFIANYIKINSEWRFLVLLTLCLRPTLKTWKEKSIKATFTH